MPQVPIFVDQFTRQTLIYSPEGGGEYFLFKNNEIIFVFLVYIIPPLVNFYGKSFSIAELIDSGYASLVSDGGPLTDLDMGTIFRPVPCKHFL